MNPDTALALRDIHLPEPVSWWPPAPGWWLLLFALIVLCLSCWFMYRRWQHRQQQRDSLKAFTNIQLNFNQDQNRTKLVRELSILLRRSCITFYPRELSASLTGESWLQFLAATSMQDEFTSGAGQVLASAPYLSERSNLAIDAQALLAVCENWLRAQPNKTYLKQLSKAKPSGGARP